AMKFKYAPSFDKDTYDNNKNFQEISNFDSESEEENNVFFNIQESQFDPKTIIKEIKNIIYNSLFEYWDYMSQICLLSTLLDPQLRKMTFASDDVCNYTIEKYRFQLHQLMSLSEEQPISSNPTNISSNNMFKDIVFDESEKLQDSIDKLDF
ncbi:1547_t:CDS:2, partial [Dentiscutata erythropus]